MRLLRRAPEVLAPPPRDLHAEFRASWDQLEIHHQHIHSTTNGVIYATEALLRWRRSPNEIWAAAMALPIAEEIGLVEKCTSWATELSLTKWERSTFRSQGGCISLNLHRTQLEKSTLATDIISLLDFLGIAATELVFEIPDRIGPDACRAAVDNLGEILDLGARLALDDHRGSASRTDPHPSWLPMGSLVKLDPALTSVCDDPIGRELLELSADKLHADGYEVVAEAIERPSQLSVVMQCNIAWAQGYLFARPRPLL